ncbi:MAG: Glycosyl transferase family 2 [Candidatus Moranbacteria bacterium GW2011_GWE1_49_15]|nr:MAG: Glycosyl transferase family 2 [Candidatus Moranbacteria bacterium GW2011_GWE1_49_15]HBP01458.1 hypothetical protein [Candidatus Moranbacteria bacterium]
MKFKEISVVVPCFNEGRTIYKNIHEIHRYLEANFGAFEIITVNDGSSDNTLEELRKLEQEIKIMIVHNPINGGKGKAVREGILASKFEIAMFLDADLAIPIEELGKFVPRIETGADLAIASRFVPGLIVKIPVIWYRKIMENVFRVMRMAILDNWKIKDTQCGFKVFKGSAARKIFSMATVDRFAFDSEIIFIASKIGCPIKELPITLENPRFSHIRIFYDPLNMLSSLLRIRFNDFLGAYKYKTLPEHGRVIISADDFGKNEKVNSRTLELAEKRKIGRVAIMTDGVFSPEEITRLKNSGVLLDIHLTATKQKERKGFVLRSVLFIFGFFFGNGTEKTRLSWENQIGKFIELFGKNPDGINSHEHIHFFPPYFKIVSELAEKYGIKHIRFGKNVMVSKNPVSLMLHILNKINQRVFKKTNLKTSDNLIGLDWTKDSFKKAEDLGGQTEIVSHPERDEEYEIILEK